MLGKSLPTAKRVIKMRAYKGKPLVVRQERLTAGAGRAAYLVLWDTDTNQPATLADQPTTGEHHDTARILPTERKPLTQSVGNDKNDSSRTENQSVAAGRLPNATNDIECQPAFVSAQLTGEHHDTANRSAGSATSHSSDTATTRSGILPERSQPPAVDHCGDDRHGINPRQHRGVSVTDSNAAVAGSGISSATNGISTITIGEDHAGIQNFTRGDAGVGAGKTPKKLEVVEGALGGDKDVSSEPENNNRPNQVSGNANKSIVNQPTTGEPYGYADPSTDATLNTRDISGITSNGATSAGAVCAGVQQPITESGREIDLDSAAASPLVESSALSLPEQAITDEPDVHGERQAGNGGAVSQGSVAEVITLPVRGTSQGLDSDMAGELVVANGIDPEGNWDELSKDAQPVHTFDDLLYRHLLGRNPASKRTLKCKYTKQYNETGIIPPVLFGNGVDGRKGHSGLKSTLPEDIKIRFEAMIRERADKASSTFRTKRHRRVTVMHRALEKELNQVIAIHKLNQWLKSQPDLKALIKMEDAEKITNKTPSAFPMIPVGSVIMMDGVEADYFELVGGDLIKKPLKPVWIELFDTGSRKLMAMHAYGSESNENSADIFNRFIRGNDFAHQAMHIRPDNAKGFLNLKHVLHELNQHCKATKDGFTFIDDYARPLKPKDKAHLESSHRLFHDWEDTVITHYERLGRVVGRRPATRRIGNKVVDITITQIDITLEEFNASGLTQEYVDFHNNNDKHRFTEDGVQKIWSPAQRWDAHINDYMTANDGVFLTFSDAESRIVKIHGCRKHNATISKEGTITFQKRRYSVNASLIGIGVWSRSTTTHIKVGLLSDDALALFSAQNGQFIGEAAVVVSMEAPKHVTDSIKAKVMKADSDTRRIEIVEVLRKQGFIVSMGENGNYQLLVQVINLGLTIELTKELLISNKEKYDKRLPQYRLGIFKTDADRLLKTPDKIIQYAGEVS